MKDNFDANGDPRSRREPNSSRDNLGRNRPHTPTHSHQRFNGHRSPLVDSWTFLDLVVRRWLWLIAGAVLGAGSLFLLLSHFTAQKFTASAQLLRYESPVAKDFFQGTPISGETFAGLLRSPELLHRVGTNGNPPIAAEKLTKQIKIDPESDSDIVKILLAAPDPGQAVALLNAFLDEAVAFTRDYQAQQAALVASNYLAKQVEKLEEATTALEQQFRGIPGTNGAAGVSANRLPIAAARISPEMLVLNERLSKAYSEFLELSAKYYDIHPAVQQKQAEVEAIKRQLAAATNTVTAGLLPANLNTTPMGQPTFNPELDILRTKLLSAEEGKIQLANRLRQAELMAEHPPGMTRILAPANLKNVQKSWRSLKLGLVAVVGGVLGTSATLLLILLVEVTDRRLRSAADVQRVTGLPILTTLGDLNRISPERRAQWAFRAWTMLQGRLSRSANHGLVCGITSCTQGEGRSTWIRLLAEAASLTGFRVLTIATKPSPNHPDFSDEPDAPLRLDNQVNNHEPHSGALTTNVLATPGQVTEQLTGAQSQPVVHIPLPGWVWNLERRKQWRDALNHWRRIDNLVILVELPPAGVAEAVLLGSNLPNLIWLADSGAADAGETRAQLETLRHARCNLVGAVLNREHATSLRKRFPRWMGSAALFIALGFWSVHAQPPQMAATRTSAATVEAPQTSPDNRVSASAVPASFSIVNPSQRAAWQQHLTLGPGDVISISFYGAPELTRTEVAIAPDGMVNYLEATNVLATGLSIDEFRAKLDEALGQYRRAPRTIINPVSFKSKKYYMLGKVMTKGVYTLDRPMTVLEAIARAHGFENGLVDRNIIDLADFQRSFLVRKGKRIRLNFERLFQEGDLSQNIALEPDDYLFFPSTNIKEVYVVGEVRLPGTVTFTPDLTIIAAIAARGGYTDRAFKARVLVVRGSINNPEAFAVDTHAILDARTPNFQLRPKDIVYVNSRPFIRVEELAELATTAFIQSLITTWVGVSVVKPIQ